jgi:hypothetical protein
MRILENMKQVGTQGNSQFCLMHASPEPGAPVTRQVMELDTAFHQAQVGGAPGRSVARLGWRQVHDQKRTSVYQRQARLPSLEDLVRLTQNRERHADTQVVGSRLPPAPVSVWLM